MNKTDLHNDIINNYDAFYLMTRTAAMLGTKSSKPYNQDASALLNFIGEVYEWPTERTETALSLILGEMMRVGLVSDYLALASGELLDEQVKENMLFYEIKGKAIEEVNRCEMIASTTGQRAEYEIKNNMGYTSFHHVYEPHIRFSQIKKSADGGEVVAMFQEALMLICGIGCESDIVAAQRLLQNLLLWGEKAAALALSFLWKREKNNQMSNYYKSIYKNICNNKSTFSNDNFDGKRKNSDELCIIISAIQSFVVKNSGKREVDVLFADLINCEDYSFEEKIDFIKKYKDGSWINAFRTNDIKKPIGF